MVHGPSRLRLAVVAAAFAYAFNLNNASSVVEIGKAFWVCNSTATTHGFAAIPIELCGVVYKELKGRMWGREFALFLNWWNEHKAIAHERRRGNEPL
jgi:hypothetical protein